MLQGDSVKSVAIVARIARYSPSPRHLTVTYPQPRTQPRRASRVLTMAQRFPRLQVLSRSFTRMLPVIAPHGGMFLVMFTIFIGAGMGLFAGLSWGRLLYIRLIKYKTEHYSKCNLDSSPWQGSRHGW